MTELTNIIALLKSAFEKNAWHGPSVKEAIKNITQEQAVQKLNNTHSIIELTGHITVWRRYVIGKLTGDVNFTVTDELNFPAETNWKTIIKDLTDSQSELLLAIEKFPEEKLYDHVPLTEYVYTYHTLLHGIIHHDIYHAGQIMVIRKLFNF
jgi:uncharacterized damage-inducible protein DinB